MIPASVALQALEALDAARPRCDPCVYEKLLAASTALRLAISEQRYVAAPIHPESIPHHLMHEGAGA